MRSGAPCSQPFRVVIAGAGVAGLEAALALADLAGDRVAITLLAPESDFVLRPSTLTAAFERGRLVRAPVARVAEQADAEVIEDSFSWVDPGRSIVHTEGGLALHFDALLLALGTRRRPAYRYAVTLEDTRIGEQVDALIAEITSGRATSLAVVIPVPMPWPLPAYELALMTAQHARAVGRRLRVALVIPERSPLAVFGPQASRATATELERRGVTVTSCEQCGVPDPGVVFMHPGPRTLRVDRVVALPQLFGPPSAGIPGGAHDGFIAIDPYCAVRGMPRVFAAGDGTDFPIKHGSIAAQQADTAARSIAALAGADVEVRPFQPNLSAMLLGGSVPLALAAWASGSSGSGSHVHEEAPPSSPAAQLAAKYLTPFLNRATGVPTAA